MPDLTPKMREKLSAVLEDRKKWEAMCAKVVSDHALACRDPRVVAVLGEMTRMFGEIDTFMTSFEIPREQDKAERKINHFHTNFEVFYTIRFRELNQIITDVEAARAAIELSYEAVFQKEEYQASTQLVALWDDEIRRLLMKHHGGEGEYNKFQGNPALYMAAARKLDPRIAFLYRKKQGIVEINKAFQQAVRQDLETPPHVVKPETLMHYHHAMEREIVSIRSDAYQLASGHLSHRNTKIIHFVTDSLGTCYSACQSSRHPFNFHCSADDESSQGRVFTALGKKVISVLPQALVGKTDDTDDEWDVADRPLTDSAEGASAAVTPLPHPEQEMLVAFVPQQAARINYSKLNRFDRYLLVLEKSMKLLQTQWREMQSRIDLEPAPEKVLYTDRAETMMREMRGCIATGRHIAPEGYHFEVDEEIKDMTSELVSYVIEQLQYLHDDITRLNDEAIVDDLIVVETRNIFSGVYSDSDEPDDSSADELVRAELKKHNPYISLLKDCLGQIARLQVNLKKLEKESKTQLASCPSDVLVEWCEHWCGQIVRHVEKVRDVLIEGSFYRDSATEFDRQVDSDEYRATGLFINHLEQEIHRLLEKHGESELRIVFLCKTLEQFRKINEAYEADIDIAYANSLEIDDVDATSETYEAARARYHQEIQRVITDSRTGAFRLGQEHVTHQHTKLYDWLGERMKQAYGLCGASRFNFVDELAVDRATQVATGLVHKTTKVATTVAVGAVCALPNMVDFVTRGAVGLVAHAFFKPAKPAKNGKRSPEDPPSP